LPDDKPPRKKIWCLTRDGWREVDDPLPDEPDDWNDRVRAAGYDVYGVWGHEYASLRVEVHAHESEDRYLVSVDGVNICRWFLIDGLPQLLIMMPNLLAMVRAAAELDAIEDTYEAELERQRRNVK
jgi:hypothetical protein